jgi:hypothetical protein
MVGVDNHVGGSHQLKPPQAIPFTAAITGLFMSRISCSLPKSQTLQSQSPAVLGFHRGKRSTPSPRQGSALTVSRHRRSCSASTITRP